MKLFDFCGWEALHFLCGDIIPHFMLSSRQKRYLDHYLEPLQHSGELSNIKFIDMDCHDAYRRMAHRYMKVAAVCADSFHLIKQLNDSFSKPRVRIMKKQDPDSIEYYLLKRWRNLLIPRSIVKLLSFIPFKVHCKVYSKSTFKVHFE